MLVINKMNSTLFAPFTKLVRAVRERGWRGTVIQLYLIGDLKFGELKGTDGFGNKYYENLELPYGQHRWVEYKNIHDYDATMIQPEWHGWMHHMFDETPNEPSKIPGYLPTVTHSDARFNTHFGKVATENEGEYKEQVDTSQYRQRGYKVGSLMTGPDDPDTYYKQPGHPLSPDADKGGRFKELKNMEVWTPIRKKG